MESHRLAVTETAVVQNGGKKHEFLSFLVVSYVEPEQCLIIQDETTSAVKTSVRLRPISICRIVF